MFATVHLQKTKQKPNTVDHLMEKGPDEQKSNYTVIL